MGEYQFPSLSTMFFFSITGRMARDMATNCPPFRASTIRQSCGAQEVSPRPAQSARQAQSLFIIFPSSNRYSHDRAGRCAAASSTERIPPCHKNAPAPFPVAGAAGKGSLSPRPFSRRSAGTGKKVHIPCMRASARRTHRARTTPDDDSHPPIPPGEKEA